MNSSQPENEVQTVRMDFRTYSVPCSRAPKSIEQAYANDVRIIRETPLTEAQRDEMLREARHVYTTSLSDWEEAQKARVLGVHKQFRADAEKLLSLDTLPERARDLFWGMAEEKADRAYADYFNSENGSWKEDEWFSTALEELQRCRDIANAVLGIE